MEIASYKEVILLLNSSYDSSLVLKIIGQLFDKDGFIAKQNLEDALIYVSFDHNEIADIIDSTTWKRV